MDGARTIDDSDVITADEFPADDEPRMDRPPMIGTDERRMHVRAYNRWASLLGGRTFPKPDDIHPEDDADLGPYSILIDFREDVDDPAIAFLGRALRDEGGHDEEIRRLSEVPGRSLVSRLTDHHLEIIANRAPIGFEAEFVNRRGCNAMYRGILMPLSGDGTKIDMIYGVINWKEAAEASLQSGLSAQIAGALAAAPAPAPAAPIWADGPNRHRGAVTSEEALADRLATARMMAETVRGAEQRSRAALYRALGLAYDFAVAAEADPEGLARLLAQSHIKTQPRAPFTPIVKLVFGADYDKTRLTEFAAALAHGRRYDIPAGEFAEKLETQPGGLKAVVAAEREARRPEATPAPNPREILRRRRALLSVSLEAKGRDFVLVVARTAPGGMVDLIGTVDDTTLVDRALARLAA